MDRSFTMKLTAAGAGRVCDLCHEQQASLYCSSDSAFLCSDCDSQVHTANFLVARHVRLSLCKSYHSTTTCHDDDDALSSSSSSSSSSTTKTVNSNNKTSSSSFSVNVVVSSSISSFDSKTRDVLVDWCTRVVGGGSSGCVVEVARHAFQVWCQDRRRLVWPYRVGLAASLWLGVLRSYTFTLIKDKRSAIRLMLKRLEEISGVPAKSILVAQSKLAAATLKHRRRHQDDEFEESWAEC